MQGYQADIDLKAKTYTGQIYEERGRNFFSRCGGQIAYHRKNGTKKKPPSLGSLGEAAELKKHHQERRFGTTHRNHRAAAIRFIQLLKRPAVMCSASSTTIPPAGKLQGEKSDFNCIGLPKGGR